MIAPAVLSSAQFNVGSSLVYNGQVGDTINIDVSFHDQYGNSVDGSDSITASLTGTDFAGVVTATPVLTSSGYTLAFPTTEGGLYKLNLVVNGLADSSNITVSVLSRASFASFFIYLSDCSILTLIFLFGLLEAGGNCTSFSTPINQGQVWTLICTAYNQYGKPKTTGGDTFTWVAPGGTVAVQDHNTGQYSVTYTSQSIGSNSLTLYINKKEVSDMPFHPQVIPGPLVLGTVIPAIFIAALIVVVVVFYLKKKREKEQLLLRKKRKPQQIFKPADEGEWLDDDVEQEEEWFDRKGDMPPETAESMLNAHNRVMSELELH